MKIWKISLTVVILFFLCILTFFVYTRFCLDQYEIDGNTLTFKNSIYLRNDMFYDTDEENLGKTIGIAIEGERTMTDYIWPFWVIEYKNEKEHNRIFVRGLMGSGGPYKKNIK